MTAAEYATLRRHIGTQSEVALHLGISPKTIDRRERGVVPITHEAETWMRALVHLPEDLVALLPDH